MKGDVHVPDKENIRRYQGVRALTVLLLLAMLALLPGFAAADPVTKCLQRGLKAAGHNPRGIDGIIGPLTLAAAAAWAGETAAALPDLDADTTPRWCAALLRAGDSIPPVAPGSERFCSWFDVITTGVWLDDNGVPQVVFRLAAGGDGVGCYAWLNAAPDWQILETGSRILRVERADEVWSTGDTFNGIVVDRGTGLARYNLGGAMTSGVVLE